MKYFVIPNVVIDEGGIKENKLYDICQFVIITTHGK